MGNQVAKAREGMVNRMSMRRRRAPLEEYSSADIQRKFSNIPKLTTEEIRIVRLSWHPIMKRKDEIGRDTFLELFTAYPYTKDVFQKFIGQDVDQLRSAPVALAHGGFVMDVIARVVAVLDNQERLWETLIQVGRDHFNHGALPMYFDLLGTHFVIAVRNNLRSDWYEALEYHWLAVFNIMAYCMKFGWNLQRVEEQKKARTLTNQN